MEIPYGPKPHGDEPEVEVDFTVESDVSVDQHVEKINSLIDQVGQAQLVVGLYILVHVLRNDLEAARSRNPRKNKSYKAILEHEKVKADRRTLRDWVIAAATKQELENGGVSTDLLDYTHLREIAKLPTAELREKIAKRVISESLNAKDTEQAVKAEIEKTKLDDSAAGPSLRNLAQTVVTKLADPVALSNDEDFFELLLDEEQVRREFNFREQAIIYSTADKVRRKKLSEKGRLEKALEPVQESINFLEEVMTTMDGRSKDEEDKE